jgi:hypothetical protein
MIVKTSIGFLNTDGDPELVQRIQDILMGMTNNASYPKAQALLALVKAALLEFQNAVAAANGGGVHLNEIKRQKRKALDVQVRLLAGDVNEECGGDFAVLLSSKFPHQKPVHEPVGPLPAPEMVRLALGLHSGELNASVPPVAGALTYNWRLALASAPGTVVQTQETSAAKTTFASLTPGQIYQVQANAVGTSGTSDWSSVATLMVV